MTDTPIAAGSANDDVAVDNDCPGIASGPYRNGVGEKNNEKNRN